MIIHTDIYSRRWILARAWYDPSQIGPSHNARICIDDIVAYYGISSTEVRVVCRGGGVVTLICSLERMDKAMGIVEDGEVVPVPGGTAP